MAIVFITGVTGFVGRSLIKRFIEKTDIKKFILLVRDKNKAEHSLKNELKRASDLGKEIAFFQGDVILGELGLSREELDALNEVEEVYHLASNIILSNEERYKEKIFNTNLNGTKNVLEVFKKFNKLKKFYFFSSAYACGKTLEKIKENWLSKPNSLRNFYEESKYLSEKVLKEYSERHSIPFIIIRLSIISASSEAGFPLLKNQTFYYYSRILKKAVELQQIPKTIRLVGKENSASNIIPLQNLIDILIEIRNSNNQKNFYNLVNPSNISTQSYLKGIKEIINFKGDFILVDNLDYDNLSEEEKFIYDRTKPYFEYNLIENLEWEFSNTKEVMEKLNIKNIDDNWIKEHIKKFFSFLENERQ